MEVGVMIGVNLEGREKEMIQKLLLLEKRDYLMNNRKGREGWRGTKISFNEGKKYEGIVRKRRDTITYFARNKKRRNKG